MIGPMNQLHRFVAQITRLTLLGRRALCYDPTTTIGTDMSDILLIRHAVNDYVKTNRPAGWTPEVHLNEHGRLQAAALGERLAQTKLDAIYASPLERTVETAQAVIAHQPHLTLQLLEA